MYGVCPIYLLCEGSTFSEQKPTNKDAGQNSLAECIKKAFE